MTYSEYDQRKLDREFDETIDRRALAKARLLAWYGENQNDNPRPTPVPPYPAD